MKNLFLFSCLFSSWFLLADVRYHSDPSWNVPSQWHLTPTLSFETNSLGNFTNIGLKWGGNALAESHIELVSNFSFFTDDRPFAASADFTNFDTSVRFGVFDRFNLYAELGIALDELFTDGDSYYHDYADSYNYSDDKYRSSSRPDWFAGVGAGWQMDWLTVNVYARYRYLESLEEQYLRSYYNRYEPVPERYQWFSGVELSVHF